MLRLGLQDIKRETINGPVTLEQGKIPEWLAGKIQQRNCTQGPSRVSLASQFH